jgi:3-oxoacyl-[acyl-carrier protein] reductase
MELTLRLDGKIAFVTGSTRGIGWATSRVFASLGATVVLNGHSDERLLQDRVEELQALGSTASTGMFFDVSDRQQTEAAYREILRTHKRLDILVNNAGIFRGAFLGMIPAELIAETFAVNTFSAINNVQQAARLMVRNRTGAIVNVSSIIGRVGTEGQSVYAASKAALIGLTLSAAKELAPKGIRVNAVAPGFIETELVDHLSGEARETTLKSIKMARFGCPVDVANSIAFLVSDLASYITGQVLGVDGGMLI